MAYSYRWNKSRVMKKIFALSAFVIVLAFTFSCQKETVSPVTRKIQFVLYTNEDFSASDDKITFSLIMKNGTKTLLDSSFATMKLKEIPDQAHKIVIEKSVPDNNSSKLLVGFKYELENVGYSWYYDSCAVGQSFKTVEFAFR